MASKVVVHTLESLLALGERQSSGCLVWTRGKSQQGYGYASSDRRMHRVHRLAYALSGRPLDDHEVVRHRCDNPPCFEPTHLVKGSHMDNVRDMVERGRALVGARNPRAKLSAAQVAEIRERRGETQESLAAEFGVSQAAIHYVLAGKRYV